MCPAWERQPSSGAIHPAWCLGSRMKRSRWCSQTLKAPLKSGSGMHPCYFCFTWLLYFTQDITTNQLSAWSKYCNIGNCVVAPSSAHVCILYQHITVEAGFYEQDLPMSSLIAMHLSEIWTTKAGNCCFMHCLICHLLNFLTFTSHCPNAKHVRFGAGTAQSCRGH